MSSARTNAKGANLGLLCWNFTHYQLCKTVKVGVFGARCRSGNSCTNVGTHDKTSGENML